MAKFDLENQGRKIEWRKASFSGATGCVEVAITSDKILVRDTKDRTQPHLTFNGKEWEAFLQGVKHGEFDIN